MSSSAAQCLIFSVSEHIRFTAGTAEQAKQQEFCQNNTSHFVEIGESGTTEGAHRVNISTIHAFCEMMANTVDEHRVDPVIVCAENCSPTAKSNACLLCGAYLLLCESMDLDRVCELFKDTLTTLSASKIARNLNTDIVDCWSALHRARHLHWLGTAHDGDESEPAFDVEMASHYAHPANGNIHVLVPGKLLLFPSPQQLPPDQSWGDTTLRPSGTTTRHFSAAFLGDLLSELEVSAVACLGTAGERDAAAFSARGLDVHDLHLDPRRPGLLSAMDRLLAVTAAAPGAVALYGGGRGGADAPEYVGTLATAWLVGEYGFGAAAAGAWVGMLYPALAAQCGCGSG